MIGAFMWKIEKLIKKGEYMYALVPNHPNTTKAQCCSRSCGCKLGRMKQLNKVTHEVEIAISENLLSVYTKYIEDNSEETLG